MPQRGAIPQKDERALSRPHPIDHRCPRAPPEELRAVAAYHKALSDPTRLRILQRLAEGPATVTELTSHVDLSQPLVSFHLHRLKAAGVVETRRAGREVICTVSRDVLQHFRARERELLGLAG